MTDAGALAEGARNLLLNCADLTAGQTVLVLAEDPALGWYDAEAPRAVAEEARRLGMVSTLVGVGDPADRPDRGVAEAIAEHDCTVFFARIGDQDRFSSPIPGRTAVMCYARDADMLGSAYGRASHHAFHELKEAIDEVLLNAKRIEITCRRGTAYAGVASEETQTWRSDTSVRRFPLGVPLPMSASDFSGRLALVEYLTPTGSRSYEPAYVAFDGPLFAEIERGRIVGFTGDPAEVARAQEHYQRIADKFGIERDVVHSWHAGIHPGCAYVAGVAENPDRWSNTVFTNPRFVHFHTCGDYAPGEICLMVLDQTISVDGVTLWDHGRLRPEALPETKVCLDNWPELNALFAQPSDLIGLADDR